MRRQITVLLVALMPSLALGAGSGFRFAPVTDRSLGLWEGERPVLVYNHGEIKPPPTTAPSVRPHSNYVHPIYGLDGEVLTGDFPADHVHHRGLYWAWPHVKVGDQQVDLWSLKGIRTEFVKWIDRSAGADLATLGVESAWLVGDKKVMREEAWLRIQPAGAESRVIDVELKWTPIDQPVTLRGAEGKSYGGLSLRYADRTKSTIITTSAGKSNEDLVVTRLPWADLSGDFAGTEKLSGIAIFVHPQHSDHPPEWMARYYGMLAVGWPGVKERTLPAGETITCRYRVWIHRGAPNTDVIQRAYDAYIAGGGR